MFVFLCVSLILLADPTTTPVTFSRDVGTSGTHHPATGQVAAVTAGGKDEGGRRP